VGLRLARERNWKAPSTDSDRSDRSDRSGGAGADAHPVSAAQQADTSRAQSESEVQHSAADTAPDAKPSGDASAGADTDSKGP
jgi:NADH-quinone oxidoreductase subunit E